MNNKIIMRVPDKTVSQAFLFFFFEALVSAYFKYTLRYLTNIIYLYHHCYQIRDLFFKLYFANCY